MNYRLDAIHMPSLLIACAMLFVIPSHALDDSRDSNAKSFTFEGVIVETVVIQLSQKFDTRVCLERLDYPMETYESVGSVIDTMESTQLERSLSLREKSLLTIARQMLTEGRAATFPFKAPEHEFSGTFIGDDIADLLDSILADSPYTWRETNNTFVIYPREMSRLLYPVTLHVEESTPIGNVLNAILGMAPDADENARHLKMVFSSRPAFRTESIYEIRTIAPLDLVNVTAMEALCRAVEAVDANVLWNVSGIGPVDGPWPRPLAVGIMRFQRWVEAGS